MTVSLLQFQEVRESLTRKPYSNKNFIQKRSLSFSYLRYRLLRPILKRRYWDYQKKHPNQPWLCPDAISALQKLLPGSINGLEYGSGRSTTFFAPYFDHYTSIEHNKRWYKKVEAEIKHLSQVEYHLIEPEEDVPQQHLSSDKQTFLEEERFPVPDEVFKTYSDFVLSFDDSTLDFVLIDGRARKTCALNALNKLKSGGLLVLDNSERIRYSKVHQTLKNWPKIETTTGLTNTTIWRKP